MQQLTTNTTDVLPAQRVEPPPITRAKRGRYTSTACTECKKNKTKCKQVNSGDCERCIAIQLHCVYPQKPSKSRRRNPRRDSTELAAPLHGLLDEQVQNLRQEMMQLRETVGALHHRESTAESHTEDHVAVSKPPELQQGPSPMTPASSHQENVHQFVSATRPAFGLKIGEKPLARMGIPSHETFRPAHSLLTSQPSNFAGEPGLALQDDWSHYDDSTISRLFNVWSCEVNSQCPFVDKDTLEDALQHVQQWRLRSSMGERADPNLIPTSLHYDTGMIVLCTGLVLEAKRKCDLATSTIEIIRARFFQETFAEAASLKRAQFLSALGHYYFLTSEELTAWRMIGLAARDAMELGLHQKSRLLDTFDDHATQQNALRTFWCIYILDRRWSFGTGLPFALTDADIDPALPKLDDEHAYLKCTIGYSQLCSKIWPLISTRNSTLRDNPNKIIDEFDLELLEWHYSIPPHLQLRHPRLGMAPPTQPSELQRIRTLLYLRGNHARCLVYRQYVLGPEAIRADPKRAWLIVSIAEDSVDVLAHLNATTAIYAGQPYAFHYYLTSALGVLFLAMCHGPEDFVSPCRKPFLNAMELIKIFSHQNPPCNQLWKTMRKKLLRMKSPKLPNGPSEPRASNTAVSAEKHGDNPELETYTAASPNEPANSNDQRSRLVGTVTDQTWDDSSPNAESPSQSVMDFDPMTVLLHDDFIPLDNECAFEYESSVYSHMIDLGGDIL